MLLFYIGWDSGYRGLICLKCYILFYMITENRWSFEFRVSVALDCFSCLCVSDKMLVLLYTF